MLPRDPETERAAKVANLRKSLDDDADTVVRYVEEGIAAYRGLEAIQREQKSLRRIVLFMAALNSLAWAAMAAFAWWLSHGR